MPGIRPPEASLIVPSNVPLVFKVWAADMATPTRASNNTKKALPSKRLADSGWLELRKGFKSHTPWWKLIRLMITRSRKRLSKPRNLILKSRTKRCGGDPFRQVRITLPMALLIARVPVRNDYFDGTAEIEEARIVLREMVPCAVTLLVSPVSV